MRIIVLLLVLMISIELHAQENAFLTPMGAYEGIAGNTGIGRDGSVGSVIYNPAGMASIKSSKLSASGSAFSQNHIQLRGGGVNDDVKYIQTIPAQITTVFTNPNFNWAFSILVPKASDTTMKLQVDDPDLGPYTLNQKVSDTELLIGPSMGLRISNNFNVGLSVFASKRDFKQTAEIFLDDGTIKYLDAQKDDISATALVPIVGILYTPSKDLSIGLRFSGPSTQLTGSNDSQFQQVFDDGATTETQNVSKTTDVNYEKPMDLGVGFSFSASKNLRLLIDVSNQFQKKYTIYKENAQGEGDGESNKISLKNVQRYNLGLEYQVSHTDVLTFGFMHTPDPEEGASLDFSGLTLGYRTLDSIADSSFGIFYNQAKDTVDEIETKQTMVGLFISSSINFLN
jgi:hypothetical protein